MATKSDKKMNQKMRAGVHKTPSVPREPKPPTPSESFSKVLRQEGRRSVRVEIVKPKEEVEDDEAV